MILSAKKILELNEKYHLITGLSERELKNPEGVGIDLRAGAAYKLVGEGYLGETERKTPEIQKIADIKDGDKVVIMNPGDYILVKTIESVNLPADKIVVEEGANPTHLIANVHPRSTLQRSGIYFRGTKTDPGYSGELTFALANLGGAPFKLELGARFVNIVFEQVVGDIARAYEGQWQGGRVAAEKKEKQN
ncbi:MAG: dCTP deaminase domain-containing protein [Candidatus Micrarchaeales archaeon]